MSAINEKAVNGTQLQRTHKKIYRHLMPLLIVAYIISFIDRTNIGMAKATMSVDIGLSATAFGLGAGLFFLTYAVLEIPSNLFLTRIGARRWIARYYLGGISRTVPAEIPRTVDGDLGIFHVDHERGGQLSVPATAGKTGPWASLLYLRRH